MAFYKYPPSGGASANASVGTSGSAVPTSATLAAGKDPTGLLKDISVDAAEVQNANVVASVLPTGASTSAAQTTGNTSLSSIDTKTPSLGQALAAASVPVVLPAAQVTALTPPTTVTVTQATGTNLHTTVDNFPATQAVSATALPLPAGASTSANQATEITALQAIQTQTNGVATAANQSTMITSLATVATNSGTQATAANQTSGNATLTTIATNSSATQGTVAAGTAATKADLVAGVYSATPPTLTNGQQVAMQVDSNGRQLVGSIANALPAGTNVLGFVKQGGKTQANAPIYNAYGTTSVLTTAYTQLVPATAAAATELEIFDSSGSFLYLATGAAGSEVIQAIITPGGNGRIPLSIASGSRIAIKAIDASATSGAISINLYA